MDNKAQILNRIYPGVDLTIKFAAEIAGHASVWDWIKARIQAVNYSGICVGDYIPFALTDGKAFKAEVAGIDTYYRYGDTEVSHHIDFITRDCHPVARVFNKVNYNNGLSTMPCQWLASDLYAWLNSLQMSVPNEAKADPATIAVDYRTTGVYDKLPTTLRNVIVQKRALLPRRYAAGLLLIDDNGWDWRDAGFLWIPSEAEIYGHTAWGSTLPPYQGYDNGGAVQYPLFSCNMTKRIKGAGDGGGRSHWWLLSTSGGNSADFALVITHGNASHDWATHPDFRVPLCFRIA